MSETNLSNLLPATRIRHTRWRRRPILQIHVYIPVLDSPYSNDTHDVCYWRDATAADLHLLIEALRSTK